MRHALALLVLLVVGGCGDPAGTTAVGLKTMGKALDVRAKLEIRQLRVQLEQYHTMRGEWPERWSDIGSGGQDPWGRPYEFEIDGDRAIVFSAGPDGTLDTADDIESE